MSKINFPKIESVAPRNWGEELMLCKIPGVLTLKKLILKAGNKGGLQYHRKKNECGYLLSGELIIRYLDENKKITETTLKAGEVFHFPPNAVHQEEAITDCVIIEASSPHLNDRVRVEEMFGLKDEGGLPTTKIEDIIEV